MPYGKKECSWKQHKEVPVKGWNYTGGPRPEKRPLTGLYKPTGTRKEKLYTKVAGVDRNCPIGTGNRILHGRRGRAGFYICRKYRDLPEEKILQERVYTDFK